MAFMIGNLEIKNKFILAPMAGVCNIPFRVLCKEYGAGLVCAEMVSDKALVHGNQKTFRMIDVVEEERPLSMQIFGADIDSMVKAAKIVEEHSNCDIIDINMGCPVPKVAKKAQAGSALLKDVNKVYEVVKAVVDAVSLPVTVKIRSGWDDHSINAVEVAKMCEKAGCKAIAVHGRTRAQMYEGKADLDIIRQVKEAVNIPVIGNGDVMDIESARRMFEVTGVDAIMIGRGTLGNPFIFEDLNAYFNDGVVLEKRDIEYVKDVILRHLDELIKLKGEKVAVLEMRSHLAWYLKGYKDSKFVKRNILQITSKEDIVNILDEYIKHLKA